MFEAKFWARVDRRGTDECWEWTGTRLPSGYGKFSPKHSVDFYGHRYSYELHKGPIPDGLVIDHLCSNPPCVNPAHLDAVTQAENLRRSNSPSTLNTAKTECLLGHPFDEANTLRLASGARVCRACARERRSRARKSHGGTLAPGDPRHGTAHGYTYFGCRCPLCSKTQREYSARYYQTVRKPLLITAHLDDDDSRGMVLP